MSAEKWVRSTDLTDKQKAFAYGLSRGLTVPEAAKFAGYATANPANAYTLARDARIKREVRMILETKLETELAPEALGVYREAMKPEYDIKTRLKGADSVTKLWREMGTEKIAEAAGDLDLASLEKLLGDMRLHVAKLEQVATGDMIDITDAAGLFDE